MEDSTIYLGDTKSSFTQEELANKIYDEGKTKVKNLFKAYKNEMDYTLSQPHLSNENKLKLIADEIEKLGLTFKVLKLSKSPVQQKQFLIESFEMVLGSLGERVLPMHQFNIHTGIVSNNLLKLKKNEYLSTEFEKYVQKPEKGEKIEWHGTATEFGLFVNEFVKAGYIKLAGNKKQPDKDSWNRTAQLLFDTFSVLNLQRDGETSPEYICKVIKKPPMTDIESGFFKITRLNRRK
jgi:hypothetical protein